MERRYRHIVTLALLLPSLAFGQLLTEARPALLVGIGEPIISANPDLYLSTSNDYGPWGAPESYYSFTNDYGPIGSPESYYGVSNTYGAGLRIGFIKPVFEPVEMSFEILEGY
jgi:hypothetical protein